MRRLLAAAKLLLLVRAALPRWVAGLLVFGLLPIPGPVDEAALLVALAALVVTRWTLVKALWSCAGMETA